MNGTKLEANTKQITCPAHGKHQATLYMYGHEYAGIWECPKTGESDSCEHESTRVEETVTDYHDPGNYYGHGQRTSNIYVCEDCECTVDGDPDADAAEDRADMAYDEWRDNQL